MFALHFARRAQILTFGGHLTDMCYGSHAAGATPAHVAEKAGHRAVAQLLQAAAEGQPPEDLPSREALVQRYLGSSDIAKGDRTAVVGGSGGAAAAQLGARSVSLQLAAAERGDASVEVQMVARRDVSVTADALEKVLESPTSQGQESSSSGSGSKSERSASLPEPGAAADGTNVQQKAPGAGVLAAARQLARRGFEGWGTPGESDSLPARARSIDRHLLMFFARNGAGGVGWSDCTVTCMPPFYPSLCRHGASRRGAAVPAPCGAHTGEACQTNAPAAPSCPALPAHSQCKQLTLSAHAARRCWAGRTLRGARCARCTLACGTPTPSPSSWRSLCPTASPSASSPGKLWGQQAAALRAWSACNGTMWQAPRCARAAGQHPGDANRRVSCSHCHPMQPVVHDRAAGAQRARDAAGGGGVHAAHAVGAAFAGARLRLAMCPHSLPTRSTACCQQAHTNVISAGPPCGRLHLHLLR